MQCRAHANIAWFEYPDADRRDDEQRCVCLADVAAAQWQLQARRACRRPRPTVWQRRPGLQNDKAVRGGVTVDKQGAPVGYWITNKHPGDQLDNVFKVEVRDSIAIIAIDESIFPKANLFSMISGATSVGLLATNLGELERKIQALNR